MSAPDGRAVAGKDFGVTALRDEVLAQMKAAGYPLVQDLSVHVHEGGQLASVTMTVMVNLDKSERHPMHPTFDEKTACGRSLISSYVVTSRVRATCPGCLEATQ